MPDDSLNPETQLNETEQARRDFVKAAGKLALYTPPVMLLLMKPTTNAIAESAGLPPLQPNGSGPVGPHHHRFWLWRWLGMSD